MVYVFLADGFEEIEALTPVDVLRRAGIECKTAGVTGSIVTGSHNIQVKSDISADEIDFEKMSAVILPGGMPGAKNLEKSETVKNAVLYAAKSGKTVAAICAAPYILGKLGLLKGKRATCFPGYEKDLLKAEYTAAPVETDGNIITASGAGTAMLFAFEILKKLEGSSDKADKIYKGMQCI